jgi:hypothetical protein
MTNTNRRIMVQVCPGKKQDPIPKTTRAKRAGRMAQMVECLPSKREALNSNPSTTKTKQNKGMTALVSICQ